MEVGSQEPLEGEKQGDTELDADDTGTVLVVPRIEEGKSFAQQAYELMVERLGTALFDPWDELPDSARASFKERAGRIEALPSFEQCAAILQIGAKLPR